MDESRPFDPTALENAIAAYEAGMGIGECCATFGVARTTFNRHIRQRGVFENRRRLATPPGLAEDYAGGESVLSLSLRHGISRRAVERMLTEVGVPVRGQSAATLLAWSRVDPADRPALLAPAHAASRGRVDSEETHALRARSRVGVIRSEYERALGAELAARNVAIEFGTACGRYNIDIVARETVAVEIFGGEWHSAGNHRSRFPERSRYILDAPFDLLIAWADKRSFSAAACADHVIEMLTDSGENSTTPRRYHVMRGDGHLIAARGDDGGEVPFIRAHHSRHAS